MRKFLPLILALCLLSGCNKDNIVRQLSASDGAVCATTFKTDGKFENPVDESRVREFMDIVKEYRKTL